MTDALAVLCVNAGSSSMKLALFRVSTSPGAPDAEEQWRWSGDRPDIHDGLAAFAAADQPAPDAVGHGVVHGGTRLTAPVVIDPEVLGELRRLVPLAPLHQPAAIEAIEATMAVMPGTPQVACFDTAFHRTLPEAAARLPLPARYWDDGIRRYGFHGLSYAYVVDRIGVERSGRAVIAHLGNGASMCAVREGESVDTTMGFTPTGGIVMGTRTGDLDPGVLVHLLHADDLDATRLDRLVNHESGLLGLSGSTADIRELLLARSAGDPGAGLAVAVFVRTVRKQIGAYAALLGGLDTLVFTGGIGEHAAAVRAEAVDGLAFLGIELDEERNSRLQVVPGACHRISADASPVEVLVVPADEDQMIARHTAGVVGR